MDEGSRRVVQSIRTGGQPASPDTDRDFHRCIPRDPPVQGQQRQALARPYDAASAALEARRAALKKLVRRSNPSGRESEEVESS
jgi:hypothetical protein